MSTKYSRILLKLSGEQLAGDLDYGIDAKLVAWIAKEVKKVTDAGCQVVVSVGGGNIARGTQVSGGGIKRVTGDYMGMLATVINALAVTDIFEANGLETRCLSNIFATQVAESFDHRLARKHLDKGRVLILAGGIGRPYLTTDTAAVSLGLELDCDAILKATKVDGVYDKDPAKHSDAKKHDHIPFQSAVEDAEIRIMDKAALGLAMEHGISLVVFNALKEGNLLAVANGETVGTTIA